MNKEDFGPDDDFDDYPPDDDDEDELQFADPGGTSALRAETPTNPRNLPCPTCKARDVLTQADRAAGYCCNVCADRNEMGF